MSSWWLCSFLCPLFPLFKKQGNKSSWNLPQSRGSLWFWVPIYQFITLGYNPSQRLKSPQSSKDFSHHLLPILTWIWSSSPHSAPFDRLGHFFLLQKDRCKIGIKQFKFSAFTCHHLTRFSNLQINHFLKTIFGYFWYSLRASAHSEPDPSWLHPYRLWLFSDILLFLKTLPFHF